MANIPHILLCGNDVALLHSRRRLLEASGYEVTVELFTGQNPTGCTPKPDLLLLCHTLTAEGAARTILRSHLLWPGVRTQLLESPSAFSTGVHGPARLLAAVAELVGCGDMHCHPI